MLLSNWDFKTPNNKVYLVTNEHGIRERRYVVRDLGASLGKARQPRVLSWFPFMRHKQGSKDSLEDFEAQGFVKGSMQRWWNSITAVSTPRWSTV
jgi:hypothetical protein